MAEYAGGHAQTLQHPVLIADIHHIAIERRGLTVLVMLHGVVVVDPQPVPIGVAQAIALGVVILSIVQVALHLFGDTWQIIRVDQFTVGGAPLQQLFDTVP